eukprot:7458684-Pyramimonas_sp.AAC.1
MYDPLAEALRGLYITMAAHLAFQIVRPTASAVAQDTATRAVEAAGKSATRRAEGCGGGG